MNLRQCEVLRAVMEAGTVTAAADRLRVSQAAVSKMLAQLERDLGLRVFKRERRRLIPRRRRAPCTRRSVAHSSASTT